MGSIIAYDFYHVGGSLGKLYCPDCEDHIPDEGVHVEEIRDVTDLDDGETCDYCGVVLH